MDFGAEYFTQLYKKLGVSLWLIFVFMVFYFLVRKVLRGREQIRRSCEVIEKQLEHIQRVIAENERREAEEGRNPSEETSDAERLESAKDKNLLVFFGKGRGGMRPQKVTVDVWKMIFSSCSYLALAFAAWVLLKLIYACFWLPNYLKEQNAAEEDAQEVVVNRGKIKNDQEEKKIV